MKNDSELSEKIIDILENALSKIANPIGYFSKYAREHQLDLDTDMALRASNCPSFLSSTAAEALECVSLLRQTEK